MKLTGNISGNPLSEVRLLLVDNDEKLRRLINNILHAFGFKNIDQASDGSEALKLMAKKKYHVVILDWEMEPMDGIEFVKTMRKNEESLNIFVPIIMLSGRAERTHIETARDAGVTEFLAKPFSVNGFRERVLAVMEHPREFVFAPEYAGPSRRRRSLTPPNGVDRRDEPDNDNENIA